MNGLKQGGDVDVIIIYQLLDERSREQTKHKEIIKITSSFQRTSITLLMVYGEKALGGDRGSIFQNESNSVICVIGSAEQVIVMLGIHRSTYHQLIVVCMWL